MHVLHNIFIPRKKKHSTYNATLAIYLSCIRGPCAVLLFQANALSITFVVDMGAMGPLKRVKHDNLN
jgi:hypothetical protein